MNYDTIAVLIPAYKPDRRLNDLTKALLERGFSRIFVIDDGCGAAYADIFDDLRGKVTVLTHETNRGKGAGLKTGIREIMKTPGMGVVTADADGQHAPDDIARVADALLAQPDVLILGARDKKAMPLRSRLGNTLTCALFSLLTGLRLTDTQTGLRGLPASALESFCALEGDRYEYEINMLIKANEMKLPVREVTIRTIYLDNNASSHFHGLKDGLKIYRLMFRQAGRFCASSLLSALVDYLGFIICGCVLGLSAVSSQIIARVISSLFNYAINSRVVFGKRAGIQSFLKYYALALCVLICSCVGIKLLTLLRLPRLLAKVLVDVTLYIVSYRVQSGRIFNK